MSLMLKLTAAPYDELELNVVKTLKMTECLLMTSSMTQNCSETPFHSESEINKEGSSGPVPFGSPRFTGVVSV